MSDESTVPRVAPGEKAELAWSLPVHRSALLRLNTDSGLTGRTQYIYVNAMDSWASQAGMKVDKDQLLSKWAGDKKMFLRPKKQAAL